MNDMNGIKVEPRINLTFGKTGKNGQGGGGGSILLITEELRGDGVITANDGDGQVGGAGGNIYIQAKKHQFTGTISTQGGKSYK